MIRKMDSDARFEAGNLEKPFRKFLKAMRKSSNMETFTDEILALAGNPDNDDSDGTESM